LFDNDHVAFVKVVVPIEPENVDCPPFITNWYKSARAPDPTIANIVTAAATDSLPIMVFVENFIDFAFSMIHKVLSNTFAGWSTDAILCLVASPENSKITSYMSPFGNNSG